jgi:hypothetical protein
VNAVGAKRPILGRAWRFPFFFFWPLWEGGGGVGELDPAAMAATLSLGDHYAPPGPRSCCLGRAAILRFFFLY